MILSGWGGRHRHRPNPSQSVSHLASELLYIVHKFVSTKILVNNHNFKLRNTVTLLSVMVFSLYTVKCSEFQYFCKTKELNKTTQYNSLLVSNNIIIEELGWRVVNRWHLQLFCVARTICMVNVHVIPIYSAECNQITVTVRTQYFVP